jgi:hypothetical protein
LINESKAYAEYLESKAKTLATVSDEDLEKALQVGSDAYMIFHPVALAADRLASQASYEREKRLNARKKA